MFPKICGSSTNPGSDRRLKIGKGKGGKKSLTRSGGVVPCCGVKGSTGIAFCASFPWPPYGLARKKRVVLFAASPNSWFGTPPESKPPGWVLLRTGMP